MMRFPEPDVLTQIGRLSLDPFLGWEGNQKSNTGMSVVC